MRKPSLLFHFIVRWILPPFIGISLLLIFCSLAPNGNDSGNNSLDKGLELSIKGGGVLQGHDYDFPINIDRSIEGYDGFELLIEYNEVITDFVEVIPGPRLETAHWKSFEVVKIEETISGSNDSCSYIKISATKKPGYFAPIPEDMIGESETLVTIRLFVSNKRDIECHVGPIRFFWLDCRDNTFYSSRNSRVFLSGGVTNEDSLESPYCPPVPCGVGTDTIFIPNITFQNGAIDVICSG